MRVSEDVKLVERLLAKERAAFDEFFTTYFPRLVRFCSRRVGAQDAVEDIVQETMVKALRNLPSYRGEALLFSWMCVICRNEISDWYKKFGRTEQLSVPLDDNEEILAVLESLGVQTSTEMSDRVAISDLVQLTLDYLPPKYGRVLELKYVHGYSVGEIAKDMGTGQLAVQSMLARARKAFRKGMNELSQEFEYGV